jgi:hypothetical protein
MGRHKSPFGPVRKLYLRYRVDDPRYQALHARIQEIPEGERNVALLDILGAGLATHAGVSAQKHKLTPPPTGNSAPSVLPAAPAPAFGRGALKVLSENWD